MDTIFTHTLFYSFCMAALLGALVGMEKEIPRKSLVGSTRGVFGGMRGYALISLLGAVCLWLDEILGIRNFIFTISGFLIVAIFVAISYIHGVFQKGAMSFASEYGALITYFIGVFVMLGSMEFAIIFAVLLTLLLSLKDYISSFKTKVSRDELIDTLKFAVIAFVILPLLPDDRYSFAMIASTFGGTEISVWDNAIWQLQFLNPHGIWFFVVAMSAIGYIGYIFTKILGKKSGVIISSVLGGLVSSTAVTAAMAEKSRRYTLNNSLYVLGTLIASCIMFLRVIFIIILFNVALLTDIAVPSLMMFGVLVGVAIYFYLKSKGEKSVSEEVDVENKVESPFQISPALKFAGFIILIKFIAGIGIVYKDVWGEGLFYYALGIISGLADVDAITQTMAVEAGVGNVMSTVAVYTVLIAVMSNNFVKGTMAWKFGDRGYGKKVMTGFMLTMVAGIVGILFV